VSDWHNQQGQYVVNTYNAQVATAMHHHNASQFHTQGLSQEHVKSFNNASQSHAQGQYNVISQQKLQSTKQIPKKIP